MEPRQSAQSGVDGKVTDTVDDPMVRINAKLPSNYSAVLFSDGETVGVYRDGALVRQIPLTQAVQDYA